ncbi:hypothetical protein RDI58_027761 [Solanum bulbocastanum]|uniref:Uncharacterized protein n=1 Tax=Solanum bulbocastanum TaxID=147425 RepID=A0AAN8SYB4_SOLBU
MAEINTSTRIWLGHTKKPY